MKNSIYINKSTNFIQYNYLIIRGVKMESKNIKFNSGKKENEGNLSNEKAPSGSEKQYERIQNIGSVITGSSNKKIYCLTIIGQIEGHTYLPPENKTTKYEHVIPELVAIEEDPQIDGLLLLLNTVGGDIEAGLAIAELIAGMNKPSVSMVIGGGHSIGVPLAVCTDVSFIANSATMTIHPVRTTGMTVGAPQSYEYFKRMQERIANFVVSNSKMSKERFYELCMNTEEMALDIGSIIEGQDAVKEGLIDRCGTLSEALECLYSLKKDKSKKPSKKQ